MSHKTGQPRLRPLLNTRGVTGHTHSPPKLMEHSQINKGSSKWTAHQIVSHTPGNSEIRQVHPNRLVSLSCRRRSVFPGQQKQIPELCMLRASRYFTHSEFYNRTLRPGSAKSRHCCLWRLGVQTQGLGRSRFADCPRHSNSGSLTGQRETGPRHNHESSRRQPHLPSPWNLSPPSTCIFMGLFCFIAGGQGVSKVGMRRRE